MKFLLDENMPPSLAIKLKVIGYDTRHVVEIGYHSTPDFKIAELAASTGEIIITHDTDFGTILALSAADKPSVILFRWEIMTTNLIFQFLESRLPELETDLKQGSLIVIDDNKMRIRPLPLKK
jgi:predicted nuclease of predicted toxin-antitoxin system